MDMRVIKYLLALLILAVLAIPAASFAQIAVGVSIGVAPPPIPVYEQPICPGDGYLWTPGYWAWDADVSDYYWVPGTWVMAPEVGFLWTPGWWGWGDGGFFWNEGFWGPTVGFYGGIDYGFGYFGHGFYGGRWDHGHFFYNTAVMNVNRTEIHNVYNERVEHVTNENRVSYNGGKGGIDARPTHEEEAAAHERHIPPVSAQTEHASAARSNPEMRAKANHGDPPVKATARPGDFSGARSTAAGRNEAGESRTPGHVSDLPALQRPEPVNSGDAKADKKYQKQQEKLYAKQEKDRQKLEAQQEKDHQKKLNEAQHQQMEQRHQQQTEQMVQRHAEERQALQSRAPQPRAAPAPRPR
jgi:hypothetical protein